MRVQEGEESHLGAFSTGFRNSRSTKRLRVNGLIECGNRTKTLRSKIS